MATQSHSPKPTPAWRERLGGLWLAAPAIFWMTFFFIIPVFIVVVMSFMTRTRGGGALPLTLDAYDDLFGELYELDEIQEGIEDFQLAESAAEQREAVGDILQPDNARAAVLFRSMNIALATTFICLLIGYPLGYFIATRRSSIARSVALFLVVLPFWTNLLVRTYAWRVMLGREGVINSVFSAFGWITEPLELMFTQGAVLVGLVYVFLPFMVLPIYANVERFDFKLVEAANDLGANDWSAFWRVVWPGTLPGVIAGSILVFIPSIGSYVTPELLGGASGNTLMIGNLIANWFGANGNWPRGSAMSVVLMLIVLLAGVIYVRLGSDTPQREKN
jgi:spermidine/putrescine transport system permease protein